MVLVAFPIGRQRIVVLDSKKSKSFIQCSNTVIIFFMMVHAERFSSLLDCRYHLENEPKQILLHMSFIFIPTIPNWIADDLLMWLTTAPHQWAEHLWHQIWLMAPLHSLCKSIQHQQQLHICSNMSVDVDKHSCCAWIIHTTTELWHREGVVPRHWEDNYSGCSKAFGILTAILFLQHYTNHFPSLQLTNLYRVTIYCDSKSVINRINWHNHEHPPLKFPNTTIKDDYDVYREIHQTIGALLQFQFTFRHIKRPQDQTKQCHPLSLPARLNIDCNKRAAALLPHACWVSHPANLTLPHSYPHVITHGKAIVRKLMLALWHAANTSDYHDNLEEKHHWTNTAIKDINWNIVS